MKYLTKNLTYRKCHTFSSSWTTNHVLLALREWITGYSMAFKWNCFCAQLSYVPEM